MDCMTGRRCYTAVVAAICSTAIAACVPKLPADFSAAQRAFIPAGEAQIATNDTLWWSVSAQRSRLDIYDRAQRTTTSTVTDPGGSGLAFSAKTHANGTCSCLCFAFRATLRPHDYLGPGVINCTRVLPDAVLPGGGNSSNATKLTRRWTAFAQQPRLVRVDYWSGEPVDGPWPLRVVNSAGTQEFVAGGGAAGVPPLAVFEPQACCAGVPAGNCSKTGFGDPRLGAGWSVTVAGTV